MFRAEQLFFFLPLLIPLISPAAVSPDPVDLFERHHYEEAASLWSRDVQHFPLNEQGVRSLKGLSMAYYQMGSLYSHLDSFSLVLSSDYYQSVTAQGKSPMTQYYWGQVHYLQGAWDSALSCFGKAAKSGGVPEGNGVFLAFTQAQMGGQHRHIPLVRLKLKGALAKSGEAQWQALDLAGADPSDIPPHLRARSSRDRRCRLSILTRSNTPRIAETFAALQAVLRDDKAPEISTDKGQNSQLDFYDPFLLGTLARAYLVLSQWWQMKLLDQENRFPDLARKFSTHRSLAQTCLLEGRYVEALQFLGPDTSVQSRIVRAKILGKQGNLAAARMLLDSVTQGVKTPGIFREVAESYYFLGVDLQKGLRLAQQALRDKDGENYYHVSAALLLANGQNDAGLEEYAKGYPIEFRDRLDQIDPEYMSDYSFAIFLNRKMRYEEVVETLYHLQKEIPACRQMHYAMQGISAAQVRGYESQRIFRKGD